MYSMFEALVSDIDPKMIKAALIELERMNNNVQVQEV